MTTSATPPRGARPANAVSSIGNPLCFTGAHPPERIFEQPPNEHGFVGAWPLPSTMPGRRNGGAVRLSCHRTRAIRRRRGARWGRKLPILAMVEIGSTIGQSKNVDAALGSTPHQGLSACLLLNGTEASTDALPIHKIGSETDLPSRVTGALRNSLTHKSLSHHTNPQV